MTERIERANAKLNISLDVIRKLPDGYHEMLMVMQTITLCDDVRITVTHGSGEVSVTTNRRYLPSGEKNIAGKAARLFMKEAGITDADLSIDIYKRIPVCAGMGGGSADAAAVLRGLNSAFGTDLDGRTLEKMGESLGLDVPFCVRGGTVLASGRGEILTDLTAMPECSVVVCKPAFSVSTPELFQRIDCNKIRCRPDTSGLVDAVGRGALRDIGIRVYNVFEDVLRQGSGEISKIKGVMLENGAVGAAMTGTGSAVFGLFESPKCASKAFETLKNDYRETFEAKICGANSV